MRPLTGDDRALIRTLQVEKGWGALRMMKEFSSRQWKRSTLNDLIKRVNQTERSRANLLGAVRSRRFDRAIGQFRKRLSLVATTGGHIEHRFD